MYFLPRHKPPTRHSGTVNVLNSAVCLCSCDRDGISDPDPYQQTFGLLPSYPFESVHFFFPTLPSQAVTTAHPKRAILDGPCIRIQELSSTT